MKWYVIMQLTFADEEQKKKFKKNQPCKQPEYKDAPGDGYCGTGGNPTNHFPSARIRMHELQNAETDPCVLYKVMSTNY